MSQKINALKIDKKDNVAVALENLTVGDILYVEGNEEIAVLRNIPYGHKIALTPIPKDDMVIKYGEVMGIATEDIAKGDHVHVSNVRGLTDGDKRVQKEEVSYENV